MTEPAAPLQPVTFLLSDVEGSTRLWEQDPEAMSVALVRHDEIFHQVVGRCGGLVVKSKGEGDSVFSTFDDPADAVRAAVEVQLALQAEAWPTARPIRVRMSVHAAEAELRDGDWFGPAVNRAARVRAVAHGAQVVVSQRAVERCRGRLPEGVDLLDLGLRRLKDLTEPEHLWQVTHPALPAAFPPVKSLDERPHNLPEQPTPLIGREHDLAVARGMIVGEGVRLLTLTGPGGVGKTRLALQLAADLLDTFDDGAFAVWLADATHDDLVASAVAESLGAEVAAGAEPVDAVIEHLGERNVLLVLDNAEQVVEAVADLVARLLAECPGVTLVVTSREWLHLRAEHELTVEPLSLPPDDAGVDASTVSQWAAPQMFLERVRAVRRDLRIDDDEARAVVDVCRRLDGLPLALELAAARVRGSSISAVRDGLESALDTLTSGPRDLPARQQALRSTIQWSFELLDPDQQVLLRRLAVFAGGWTTPAAAEVADRPVGTTRDGLTDLASKSFVRHAPDTDRWVMLQTIREFAFDQLTESPDAADCEDRHGAWCETLARTANEHLVTPSAPEWLDRLTTEHDNLRRALHVHRHHPRFVAIAAALPRFWANRGHWQEGRDALEEACAVHHADPADRCGALVGAGYLAELSGRPTVARVRYQEALAQAQEARDRSTEALAHHRLGAVARGDGDHDAAAAHYALSRSLREEIGDLRGLGMLDTEEGNLALAGDDLEAAAAHYAHAVDRLQQAGDLRETAAALSNAALVAIRSGELERATGLIAQAADTAAALGDVQREVFHRLRLAMLVREQGDADRAEAIAAEVEAMAAEVGDLRSQAAAAELLSSVAGGRDDDYAAAAAHRRRAVDLSREGGDRPRLAHHLVVLSRLHDQLGEIDRSAAARSEGLALCVELGDTDTVERIARDLAGELETGELTPELALARRRALAECASALAELALASGEDEHAARLLGAVTTWDPEAVVGPQADRVVRRLGAERWDALRAEGESLGPQVLGSDAGATG